MEKETAETAANLAGKLFSWLVIILPPMIAANVAHWSASFLSGKKPSKRARFAMFMGSLSIAMVTKWVCDLYAIDGNWRTIAIWFTSLTSEHILRFLYLESGDIIKAWLKSVLTQILNGITKNKDK